MISKSNELDAILRSKLESIKMVFLHSPVAFSHGDLFKRAFSWTSFATAQDNTSWIWVNGISLWAASSVESKFKSPYL